MIYRNYLIIYRGEHISRLTITMLCKLLLFKVYFLLIVIQKNTYLQFLHM